MKKKFQKKRQKVGIFENLYKKLRNFTRKS